MPGPWQTTSNFIVGAAYLAMVTMQVTGLHPLLSLVVVVPLMAGLGYAIQLGLLNRVLGDEPGAPPQTAQPADGLRMA